MDVNLTLARIRDAGRAAREDGRLGPMTDEQARNLLANLSAAVAELDAHLSSGGDLPNLWEVGRYESE